MKLDTKKSPSLAALGLATLALAVLALALLTATVALGDSCPNAAERFGASANLPDCRAYELVTPQIKEDNSNLWNAFGYADGEHIVYDSIAPFPGAQSGSVSPTLSYRTPEGWATRTLTPPQGPGEPETLYTAGNADPLMPAAFTSDFSTAFVSTTFASDPLDQNRDFDVYRVDVANGASSLASLPDSGPATESLYHPPREYAGQEIYGSILAGASGDGSRVYFSDIVKIPTASGTPAETQSVGVELYERHDEHTYLVGVLPDGSVPKCGAELGAGEMNDLETVYKRYSYEAISADGSNVVFHTPAQHIPEEQTPGCEHKYPKEEGALYLREHNGTPQARTVKLPGIVYLGRSADGNEIFSGGDLEGDADGGPLYEYDIATEQAVDIGTGHFLVGSADGSVIYYLADPAPDITVGGSEQKLMVYDHGVTKTVPGAGPGYAGRALTSEGTNYIGILGLENLPVTTPDGSKLLFLDRADLTPYNSAGPSCTAFNESRHGKEYLVEHCDEAYIYDLDTNSFTCVSCSTDGTPPSSGTELFIPPGFTQETPQTTYSLTEDGSQAFFETANALVPQDTNGQTDVYEWENGHIYLISSGQGVAGSRLDGVSRNGDDVLFQTGDDLLPQDIENSTQIYDARVGGGFPYTTPVYGCDSGQCQGPQTPAPAFSPPASATFVGIGNPAPQSTGPATQPKPKQVKRKAKTKKRKAKRASKRGKDGLGSRKGNRKGRK